jgi:hypothetical protein
LQPSASENRWREEIQLDDGCCILAAKIFNRFSEFFILAMPDSIGQEPKRLARRIAY